MAAGLQLKWTSYKSPLTVLALPRLTVDLINQSRKRWQGIVAPAATAVLLDPITNEMLSGTLPPVAAAALRLRLEPRQRHTLPVRVRTAGWERLPVGEYVVVAQLAPLGLTTKPIMVVNPAADH